MIKRLISILLVVCMLITVPAILASCAETEDENEQSTAETTVGEQITESEDTWVKDDVPEADFKKREFKILSLSQLDVGPDKDDGTSKNDALDDAIWRRNNYIQDRFNIEIDYTQEAYETIGSKIRALKKSNDLEYHVVYEHMVTAAGLASSGCLFNLNLLHEIDTSKPWWDKDAKTGFQVEGVLYLTAGDILPSTMLIASCMSFNKTLMDNSAELNEDGSKKLFYPYELARNGEWTLDVLANMTKDYTKDVDNDGKYDMKTDIFGMTSWHLDSPYQFFFGSGCRMIENNGVDAPEYKFDQGRLQSIYDKVYEVFVENNSLYITDVSVWSEPFEVFSEGRALFSCITLSKLHGENSVFKKMTDDYGIVPQPKYDSNSPYYSFINGAAAMVCVINVIEEGSDDAVFVGSVVEGLANASYNMVTYTLYEVTAKAKNVNDQDSADMVDIIIRNKVYDFGYAHFFGNQLACASLFCTALDKSDKSLSTYIKRDEKKTTKQLPKLLSNYRKYSKQ